jgi:hypothetical protein
MEVRRQRRILLGMDEEKTKRACAMCGKVTAALSVLLLVPVIRRLRAKQQHHKRRFPLLGH